MIGQTKAKIFRGGYSSCPPARSQLPGSLLRTTLARGPYNQRPAVLDILASKFGFRYNISLDRPHDWIVGKNGKPRGAIYKVH